MTRQFFLESTIFILSIYFVDSKKKLPGDVNLVDGGFD